MGEVLDGWKEANVSPLIKKIKEHLGNCRLVILTSVSGKVMEEPILEIVFGHKKNKKLVRSNPRVFTIEKPCLTYSISFYEVTSLVEDGRAVDDRCP